jgi:chromosome segregation protein
MYLRSLRVKGFKSFPKQTELLFEPGVAVVIGPNGSGKSNLSDAVVWALGEQSPTTVRGSSMQDVIFAGSDGRRASGGAEVELTFDNADGRLPLPTAEVSVGRRVTRDGESKYFINQSACRLTDVLELMAGIGLGRETHSIVGQGKVESFLLSKPADRRAQIEEAAGLGRYKQRRERAGLKLREVRRNLERAESMEREVTSQLAPLRRQATAAEQMRTAERELAEVRARLVSGELDAVDAALAAERAALVEIEQRRTALDGELGETAVTRATEEEAFAQRIEERERRAKRLLRARVLGGRIESCARLTEQRVRLLDELERAARAEYDRLLAELAGGPEETPADDRGAEIERLAGKEAEAALAETAAASALHDARRELALQRASADRVAGDREATLATLARLAGRRQRMATELTAIEAEVATLAAERAGRGDGLQAMRDACAAAEAEHANTSAALARAVEVADTASTARADAEAALRASAAERRALAAEADHLEATLRELQDVGSDVLEIAGRYPGAIALSSAVSCAAGYEKALAAALAQLSGAVAVPAGIDQWSLLDALRGAGVSLVRLLLPGTRKRATTGFPGALPLLDKVNVEGLEGLEDELADVVVVDDLRAVPGEFPGLAVTRAGEYYRPSAGQLGLAAGVPAAMLLERRARLDALQSQLDGVSAHEARSEVVVTQAATVAETAEKELAAVRKRERGAREAVEAARRERAAHEASLHDLDEREARLARRQRSLAVEIGEDETQNEEAEQRAARALVELEALAQPAAAAEQAAAEAQTAHESATGVVTRIRVELETRRAAARLAVEEHERTLARAREGRARLTELEARLKSLPGVREACHALEASLSALRGRADGIVAGLDAGDETGDGALDRTTMRTLADREAGLRQSGEALAEERTGHQVAVVRLEDRHGELSQELERLAADLEIAAFAAPADEAETAALREQLERLQRRRDRIGPVNPLAEAECEQLGERAGFFREQRRDLEKSITDLEELITELTAQIEEDFGETFAAVQFQFERMIAILFPDGNGRLVIAPPEAEGEPGGVAVEVKPARKLGKRLQLLSGGERALVAIAFLMALVLAHPCPFYILDEIEAALDDVNIGRFVSLVREYRDRTQFMIITHQKRTMEAADVLYGVTMGPDGASRVVSARMAEEEIEREQETAAHGGAKPDTHDGASPGG